VTNGTVTVFNQEFPDGFNPDQGREYMASVSATEGEVDITVGSNEIFVLGDNRFNSTDSRRFGSINVDSLVGPVEFRFIPINNTKKL
jgi:signal peptidase I